MHWFLLVNSESEVRWTLVHEHILMDLGPDEVLLGCPIILAGKDDSEAYVGPE